MNVVNFDRILSNNLWEYLGFHDKYEIIVDYKGEFIGKWYKSEVIAQVVETNDGLWEHEHYGVYTLEANYSPNPPYNWGELRDAQLAIESAEENLLCIGVPFLPDYEFHGKNRKNKNRRNRWLREKYNLDAIEKNRIDEIVRVKEKEEE